VYRGNKSREFNVPFGKSTGNFPRSSEFRAFAKLLRSARLVCCDFEQSVALATKGDFVYVDPPYYAPGRDFKGEYGYGAFNQEDEKRLLAALLAASKRGAKILLSYNDSLIDSLPDWTAIPLKVIRNVGGFASSRRSVIEYLYTNMSQDVRA
jgi:DNA adenine methylase